jgi:hypothetical protein
VGNGVLAWRAVGALNGGLRSAEAPSRTLPLGTGSFVRVRLSAIAQGVGRAWNLDPSKEVGMKKLLASLVAVFALLSAQAASADTLDLTAGVFPDDQLSALSSTGDPFAVGGGSAGTLHFAFSAHCKSATGVCPSPTSSGYAVVRDPTLGDAQGPVVCFGQGSPNQAVFYIETKKGSGFLGSRPYLGLFAADFNPPFAADLFFVQPNSATASCTLDSGPGGPVTQGNIVVKNR